jgi:uncharacterized membrane protein YqjE
VSPGARPAPDAPLGQRLRALLATVTALLEVRLALAGSELGAAVQRGVRGLWCGVAAVVLAGHAVLLAAAALVLALPSDRQPLALALLALLGAAGAWLLLRAASRLLRPGPEGLLPLTRAELQQDAAAWAAVAPGGPPSDATGADDKGER